MSKILHSRCIMLLIDSAKAWLQLAPVLLTDGTSFDLMAPETRLH